MRSDTKEVLGIVSERMNLSETVKSNAPTKPPVPSEMGGVFMLVNMPKDWIVVDEYQPYLCLSNAHDGSACLQVFLTGIRVVCNNTLSVALHTAKRKISIRHLSMMEQRKDEALRTMGAASKYFHGLEVFASDLAGKKVSIAKILDKLSLVSRDMSKRQLNSNKEVKELIKTLLKQKDDLQNFRGTAWGSLSDHSGLSEQCGTKAQNVHVCGRENGPISGRDDVMNHAQKIILELAA
ncbi:hypothetical protein FACS1894172_03220 [Spirochaetia bacterium]|nr:hypothetical protein FACS1894172_03220 [Spirochaetia bacterium]